MVAGVEHSCTCNDRRAPRTPPHNTTPTETQSVDRWPAAAAQPHIWLSRVSGLPTASVAPLLEAASRMGQPQCRIQAAARHGPTHLQNGGSKGPWLSCTRSVHPPGPGLYASAPCTCSVTSVPASASQNLHWQVSLNQSRALTDHDGYAAEVGGTGQSVPRR